MFIFTNNELKAWESTYPLLTDLRELRPVYWQNPHLAPASRFDTLPLTMQDMKKAEERWHRFAPFLAEVFPQTEESNGIIESPLRRIAGMKDKLANYYNRSVAGELYLKCDNELPIAGSVKARGGIYEVLHHAEALAIDAGLISKEDNYTLFATKEFKDFFKDYSIGVGSTGNLGLSIGIMSAALGFQVSVYMSADAKQWKKDLLREKGAKVVEFSGDFSEAIEEGRKTTTEDPNGYFVDDEDSKHLFLGYSTAAFRLKHQLEEQGIKVDKDHPLFVYIPCGVGGSPGGITFGLKQLFGDHVHCFFVEPTHSPAVLIGLLTGEMDRVSVQDFGLDNKTAADGLAVGRPSQFATSISDQLVSGMYTMEDDDLYRLLAMLQDTENIQVEPSATAGLLGPQAVLQSDYAKQLEINPDNINHIAWATGGDLVPQKDREVFYKTGKDLM
ncbi:D-serine ammonia-lyase [Virgibacillus halodenitrificans]|uniref:D-serine ammonia-lyase n=1 Tax=Virgibacillus halodenitrificans TaxID=1482 RepID=UPI00045CF98A|nr:D-serine ammonia-lyase [Virgibacillus halodenitrificans]CDQ32108.1 D-serine dehydratase [Virgibacillus halodenitrificans]